MDVTIEDYCRLSVQLSERKVYSFLVRTKRTIRAYMLNPRQNYSRPPRELDPFFEVNYATN